MGKVQHSAVTEAKPPKTKGRQVRSFLRLKVFVGAGEVGAGGECNPGGVDAPIDEDTSNEVIPFSVAVYSPHRAANWRPLTLFYGFFITETPGLPPATFY